MATSGRHPLACDVHHSTARLISWNMHAEASRQRGKTVLVVDDHETDAADDRAHARGGRLHRRTAKNGVEALDRLARESDEIDIVLSRRHDARMNGIDLSYQIREQYPRCRSPSCRAT